MNNLEAQLNELVSAKTIQNIFVRVGKGNEILYDTYRGKVNETTLFDMASVTKIMATTSLALIALDKGWLSLENTVKDFYPDCQKDITIFNLLTHTIGIGHKSLNKAGNTYDNIAEKILEIPLDISIGENVLYSCPGFILLGKILEKVFGQRLDNAFDDLISKSLELQNTSFLPKYKENCVNANLKEEKRGVVNDYNCQFLGGVAGNAGLFSNVADITKYVQCLLNKGMPLFREKIFDKAVQNYTADKDESRGLGFLYVDERYEQTGGLFQDGAIGHCGHTGQSIFVDYRTGLYVIVLSDATVSTIKKYGQEHYDEVMNMRKELHSAIRQDLKL
jgi:CubicO group peptidase (beta-lactamase class C family)